MNIENEILYFLIDHKRAPCPYEVLSGTCVKCKKDCNPDAYNGYKHTVEDCQKCVLDYIRNQQRG